MQSGYFSLLLLIIGFVSLGLTSCSTTAPTQTMVAKPYDVVAYAPTNPDNVRVKVSLENRAVYVMEGSEVLMVTAVGVGRPGKETPLASNGRVTRKEHKKRSGTYGFYVRGDEIIPAKRGDVPPGGGWRYQGHPMQWWVEWAPAYGFHEGMLPPGVDRVSAGCIRLHRNVAPKFYALVKVGTPVSILPRQPEDETIGKDLERVMDYDPNDRVNSRAVQVTDSIFDSIDPRSRLLPKSGSRSLASVVSQEVGS